MQPNLMKSLAIGAAAVVAAFGAWSLGKSSADTSSSSSAQPAQPAGLQAPQQQGSGLGAAVTGAAAAKAEKAALARYPGQVEVVVQLADGSYIVHVITSTGEQHVAVSKDFTVTGADQGGPGGPPPAQNAPSGPTQTT